MLTRLEHIIFTVLSVLMSWGVGWVLLFQPSRPTVVDERLYLVMMPAASSGWSSGPCSSTGWRCGGWS
jgi:hypothetical protein